jgi:ADP-ribosylglycohydrolase
MPYLTAQTRPPAGMATNPLQAFVQQQQRAAAIAHRHPQQLTQSIAQHAAHAQYYNAQFRAHAQRNQLLQGAVIPNPMVQQQIVQQHQAAARQQQAQIPQQTAQTQNIQQTQENVVSQSQPST